jgi:hypothetical protein
MDLGLSAILMLSAVVVMMTLWFVTSSTGFPVYALAAVVSLVGINIHVGVTIYFSRIVIIFFLLAVLIREAMGRRVRVSTEVLFPYAKLFGLLLMVQCASVLLSDHVLDGFRQIAIYLSLMALFFTVVIAGSKAEIVTKAVKIYLAVGLVQGLYGIYQVIGGSHGWPTYQTFMDGIPTANDRTSNGFYYSGAYQAFRATGFFPADVSHYAGYLAGVLLLAIALLISNRKSLFLHLVIVVCSIGLILSLSRSGILAFVIFGLPSLSYLLWRVQPKPQRSFWILIRSLAPLALVGMMLGTMTVVTLNIDVTWVSDAIYSRLADVVEAGENQNESMAEHIRTRLLGLDALESSPIYGVGPGVNASPWLSETYQVGWGGSHSHHINILGETGLLGAGLEWLLMWMVAKYMWRGLFVTRESSAERNLLAGMLSAFVTIVLGNIFYFYYLNDFVWFLMAGGVALSRAMIVEAQNSTIYKTKIPVEAGGLGAVSAAGTTYITNNL